MNASTIGTHLKLADKLLLQHDFDGAEAEVNKALETDPNNLYARAYNERIRILREEYKEKQKEEERRRALEEAAREQRRPAQGSEESRGETAAEANSDVVERYKERLHLAWRDGLLTSEEQSAVEANRKRLGVSPAQHRQLEREAKLTCYVEAVRAASQDGVISPMRSNALEEIRKKFGISIEEHFAVEGRILWELQHKQRGATVMVIDDETDLLEVLSESLTSNGYKVVAASSPEAALDTLRSLVPDIILCDIRFPASDLDGFAVFKKVRGRRELLAVPFIFLTGVKDEWVIQQGREIGVDDYIIKPFTMTMLLAAMEGKLQRYEELKKALR